MAQGEVQGGWEREDSLTAGSPPGRSPARAQRQCRAPPGASEFFGSGAREAGRARTEIKFIRNGSGLPWRGGHAHKCQGGRRSGTKAGLEPPTASEGIAPKAHKRGSECPPPRQSRSRKSLSDSSQERRPP